MKCVVDPGLWTLDCQVLHLPHTDMYIHSYIHNERGEAACLHACVYMHAHVQICAYAEIHMT